jgi:hypothetical protein
LPGKIGQLVDTRPAGVEQLPAVTSDHVLYVRRLRPEQVRRAIISLYRQAGLTSARREGCQYEQGGQIEGLRYAVRDLGRLRWGAYYGPLKHTTTLHWAVFGLPMPYIEYVLVHEQAHATRPGGRAHGPAWERRMDLWMPDWVLDACCWFIERWHGRMGHSPAFDADVIRLRTQLNEMAQQLASGSIATERKASWRSFH